MVNEDYVSFETAKLLREKGFDENCAALYDLRTGKLVNKVLVMYLIIANGRIL